MAIAAFISFRLKVMDGVSFEVEKRIDALEKSGLDAHRIAGMIPAAGERDHIIPEMNHLDPEVEEFTATMLDNMSGREELKEWLDRLSDKVGACLSQLLDDLDPDIVFCENIFSLPLNMPLTVALCRCIEEGDFAAVAVHHHLGFGGDLLTSCVLGDIIESYLPASMPKLKHLTLSDSHREELFRSKGISAYHWTYCHYFESDLLKIKNHDLLLSRLGISHGGTMIFQPSTTIDESVYLSIGFSESFFYAGGGPVQLVLTGKCQQDFSEEFSRVIENTPVDVVHLYDSEEMAGAAGTDILSSIYNCCDLVVCPGGENIGDPVMESVALRKPLFIGAGLLTDDVRGQGFQVLPLDGGAGLRAFRLVSHPELMKELTRRNYEVGRKYYSSYSLSEHLQALLGISMAAID